MKTLPPLDLRTSLIAVSVTVATVVSVAPAQAIQLSGSMGLSGDLDITNTANGFIWNFSENVVNDQFGDFLGVSFADNSGPEISTLEFSCGPGTIPGINSCTTDPIASFIDFGMQTIQGVTANLSFNLDAAEYMSWGNNFFNTTAAASGITGSLMFNGATLAVGTFSGGQTGNSSTYHMTLAAVPTSVPEPSTTLGIGLTLGLAGLLRRGSKSLSGSASRNNNKSA
jgi:PEP-CTERM motif